MPGRVVQMSASAGQAVAAGEVLVVLEAMKMEHSLKAPRDGTVADVFAAADDQVEEGTLLLKLLEEET